MSREPVFGRLMTLIVDNVMIRRGRKAMRELDRISRVAVDLSEEFLLRLLEENKDTEYGKKYDFANIHSIAEYQEKVPFSNYDDYEPYIRRMIENQETNLISSREVVHYALSSGSVGVPKHIPVCAETLQNYAKYGTCMCFGVMDEFYRNTTGHSFRKGLGVNTIELRFQETQHGIPKGAISGNIMKQIRKISESFLSPPWDVINPQESMDLKYLRALFALSHRDIAFIDGAFMASLVDMADYILENRKLLCHDIAVGKIDPSIEVSETLRKSLEARLKPDPDRAKEIEDAFAQGSNGVLARIWPHLQFVASIGTGGFFTYAKKMQRYTGKNIPFENLSYAASEGLFATARNAGDTSYVLIPDGGFYEFIPAKNEDDSEILTIDQLEEGEDYEIVITNLSGFYRYRIKDVVRVTGFYNQAPKLQFVYRKSQLLSIEGEKTNEEAVRWAMESFMKDTGLIVNDYSVYADTDTKPGHYVFLMEPDKKVPKERIPELREAIEARMMQANPSYGEKIRRGVLGPLELIFLEMQTYQLYREMMIMRGTSANQIKPVRVIDTPMKHKFFFKLRETYEDEE